MKIAALPDGKIGQLDAQLRQRRISTGNKRTIECIKLSVKNGQRRYAIYDVVKFHHEPMMSLSQPEHEKMHQWTVLESERGCLFIFHKARRLDHRLRALLFDAVRSVAPEHCPEHER
jgi:hypothetical protein